jgi:hypothetical protein
VLASVTTVEGTVRKSRYYRAVNLKIPVRKVVQDKWNAYEAAQEYGVP